MSGDQWIRLFHRRYCFLKTQLKRIAVSRGYAVISSVQTFTITYNDVILLNGFKCIFPKML